MDDGGPAFPIVPTPKDGIFTFTPHMGMTLRDYFAAKALQGLCARPVPPNVSFSKQAYEYADAMLKARES